MKEFTVLAFSCLIVLSVAGCASNQAHFRRDFNWVGNIKKTDIFIVWPDGNSYQVHHSEQVQYTLDEARAMQR